MVDLPYLYVSQLKGISLIYANISTYFYAMPKRHILLVVGLPHQDHAQPTQSPAVAICSSDVGRFLHKPDIVNPGLKKHNLLIRVVLPQ